VALIRATKNLYYTDAGLSMVPLYADLVADATKGRVQVCMQAQYFAGVGRRSPRFASECSILRAYRSLPRKRHHDSVVMLKMGTHDDMFASHYVLIDPDPPGSPDDDDLVILDPHQPLPPRITSWLLSDAYRRVSRNRDIAREWRRPGICPL
jgi:hypothetical protein